MTKLKCWKKEFKNRIATNWQKGEAMVDVRRKSYNSNEFHLETFDFGRKVSQIYPNRKSAEKKAIEIMKQHDKC